MTQTPASSGWSGRFSEPMSALLKQYNNSIPFDYRLALFDIQGSLAHSRMLAQQGIISEQDRDDIQRGLSEIRAEIEAGRFEWSLDLEDVHFNIERRLTERVGDAGKRLHTARSRNDQVATDMRLYARDAIDGLIEQINHLQTAFVDQAERHAELVMPGLTHLQSAQPISLGHHLLAYAEMMARDRSRFADCRARLNQLPLGAAALAGTSFPIDRYQVANELGFNDVCHNSLDAVSDRDFVMEFVAACAITMVHLSRLSEELILWMSSPYRFIDLPDRFCTGSSIMPQKKNPDVAELARGKTGRVIGQLMAVLSVMKSQPLAYNKDNQECQEALFDSHITLSRSLAIFVDMVSGLQPQAARMRAACEEGHATATDLADHLVKRGLPFRDAHEVVSRAVLVATDANVHLAGLSLAQLRELAAELVGPQEAARLIDHSIQQVLSVEGSVRSRAHVGGTAPQAVLREVKRLRESVGREHQRVAT